jgi:hypothetical protein
MRAKAWVSVLLACAAAGMPPANAATKCADLQQSVSDQIARFGKIDCVTSRGAAVHGTQTLLFADNFLMVSAQVSLPTGPGTIRSSAVVKDFSTVTIGAAEEWCPGMFEVQLKCARPACAVMSNGNAEHPFRNHVDQIGIPLSDPLARIRVSGALRQIIEGRCTL